MDDKTNILEKLKLGVTFTSNLAPIKIKFTVISHDIEKNGLQVHIAKPIANSEVKFDIWYETLNLQYVIYGFETEEYIFKTFPDNFPKPLIESKNNMDDKTNIIEKLKPGVTFTGNLHCFTGQVTIISHDVNENKLYVHLVKPMVISTPEKKFNQWYETWDLQITIWGLEKGDYFFKKFPDNFPKPLIESKNKS